MTSVYSPTYESVQGHANHDNVNREAVGFEELVRCLLHLGANPNYGPPQRHNLNATEASHSSGFALDHAATISTPRVVELLIAAGAKPECSVALHKAVEAPIELRNQRTMIEHLIKLGFEVDGMDDKVRGLYEKGSPLMCATRRRLVGRARVLLECGADPWLESRAGMSPAGEAERMGCGLLLELFREFSGKGGVVERDEL